MDSGFKVRSFGNWGRGKERVYLGKMSVGDSRHQWYYTKGDNEPIPIEDSDHFLKLTNQPN